jgi:hypothetical protein
MALANWFEESESRGRHSAFVIRHSAFGFRLSAFDDDSEGEILTWTEAQTEKSKPVIRTDIQHYC